MMHAPRIPSYGMSLQEFLQTPVWLCDELQELLDSQRDETLDAMKGKVALDQTRGLKRKTLENT